MSGWLQWTEWTGWTVWTVMVRGVAAVVLLGGLPLVALGLRALVGVALNREGRS
jgi:hypothetical protein